MRGFSVAGPSDDNKKSQRCPELVAGDGIVCVLRPLNHPLAALGDARISPAVARFARMVLSPAIMAPTAGLVMGLVVG